MASPTSWNDLPKRLGVICVGFPLLLAIWANDGTRLLFFQGLPLVLCYEWVQMTEQRRLTFILPLISSLLANIKNDSTFLLAMVMVAATASVCCDPTEGIAISRAFFLITIPSRAWLIVSGDFQSTVSLLLTVWNCDSGALVVGRLSKGRFLPKPHWLERISPNKSLEGLIGGIFFGTLTFVGLPFLWAIALSYNLFPGLLFSPLPKILDSPVVTGVALSLAATAGDLWESMLKRQYSTKDSGKLLPGHGGLLDRFDSSLIAVLVYQGAASRYL